MREARWQIAEAPIWRAEALSLRNLWRAAIFVCVTLRAIKESAGRAGDALEKAGNRGHTIKILHMAKHGLWIVRECFITDFAQVSGYEIQHLPVMFAWLRQRGFSGPRPQ